MNQNARRDSGLAVLPLKCCLQQSLFHPLLLLPAGGNRLKQAGMKVEVLACHHQHTES